MYSARLSLTWFIAGSVVGILTVPLTMLYGAAWLVPCGPILLAAIALWPVLASKVTAVERLVPMSLTIAAVAFAAALFGAVQVFGTLHSPLELLIPFSECFAVLLLPRLIGPGPKAGAFVERAV